MVKFYSVTLTNLLGQEQEQMVIGTQEQVEAWASMVANKHGTGYFSYDVKYLCTDKLDGIKNLCNY